MPPIGSVTPSRPFRMARLTEDEIQTVLEDALRRGGLGAARVAYPDNQVADAPTAVFTINAGGQERAGAALLYEQSPFDELQETIRLDWSAMDAWFEEDEEVFTHPRDPYTRVDILPSSRHVRVEVDGLTVAESTKPTLLFETGLTTRYYLPKTDVRMDHLTPTATSSHCPYKGEAGYFSIETDRRTAANAVWSYEHPNPAVAEIAGHLAFYPDRVDSIEELEA